MAARHDIIARQSMASRWRRRPMCILLDETPAPAALRSVSGHGAFIETNARPPLGRRVALSHPEAGTITAEVGMIARDGIGLIFEGDERAIAFALAAISSDMSSPS
jgi:hypothetical protein